jgi:tetratricopeptide (TPR) repeat protein
MLQSTESSSSQGQAPDNGGPRALHIGLSICIAAVAFLFALQKVSNNDIWWHLRTGRWILEHRAVPHADPFGFTTLGAAWVPHHWLSDLLFILIHDLLGMEALVAFKALIIAFAFALIFRIALGRGTNPYLLTVLTLLAVSASWFRFTLRPHIFMLLLAAVFMYFIYRADSAERAEGAAPSDGRLSFWLIPLTTLWANLHGSYFIGPVLVVFWLADRFARELYERIRRGRSAGLTLLKPSLMLGAVLAATLANPFGATLLRLSFEFIPISVLTDSLAIEEHRPTEWGEHPLFWALMASTAISLLVNWRRFRLFEALVFVSMTVLALRSGRFVALAVMLYVPIIAYRLQAEDLLPPEWKSILTARRMALTALPAVLVLGAWLLVDSFDPRRIGRSFGLSVHERTYPSAAVALLKRVKPLGNLYNSYEDGGYLAWSLPERKTFIDGRNLDAQLLFWRRMKKMKVPELKEMFRGFNVRGAALGRSDWAVAGFFRNVQRYDLVFFDDIMLVFLDRQAIPPSITDSLPAFLLIMPERRDYRYIAELARGKEAPRALAELERAVALAPHSARANFFLGYFHESAGRERMALERYARACRYDPHLAFFVYGLGLRGGQLAAKLGDWKTAAAIVEQASTFMPDDIRIAGLLLDVREKLKARK